MKIEKRATPSSYCPTLTTPPYHLSSDNMAIDCNKTTLCCEDAAVDTSYYSSFLTLISSCLSIFGSCLIILTFILWKDVRRTTARIILLFLAIADLGTGLGYLVSSAGFITYHVQIKHGHNATFYPTFCTATSFFTTFFPVSSFFWTAYLALYFFIVLVLKKPRWSRKLIIFSNLTAWPIPFIICTVAVSVGILGAVTTGDHHGGDHRNTAGWCFVSLNGTNSYHYDYTTYLLWEALCGKGWELLFFIIVIISYSVIYCVNGKQIRQVNPLSILHVTVMFVTRGTLSVNYMNCNDNINIITVTNNYCKGTSQNRGS